MRSEPNLHARIAPVTLILAALVLGSFRPVTRLHQRAHGRPGVNHSVFTWEPADPKQGDHPDPVPVRFAVQLFRGALALAPVIVLKTRWLAMVPVSIRRLKLPPPSNDPLPSHHA